MRLLLWEKRATRYFWHQQESYISAMRFLPPPSLVPTTSGSLFSVNLSLSLYNPCNNPEERASKTFFFLTLMPTDPTLLRFFALLHEISANRSPEARSWHCKCIQGEGRVSTVDHMYTHKHARMQFPSTSCPAVMDSGSSSHPHTCAQAVLLSWTVALGLVLISHCSFLPSKKLFHACQLPDKNIHLCMFTVWLVIIEYWEDTGYWYLFHLLHTSAGNTVIPLLAFPSTRCADQQTHGRQEEGRGCT